MQVALTMKSSNRKVGEIPVSVTEEASCPDECPLKQNGNCYAMFGPLVMHWRKVKEGMRGHSWNQFCSTVFSFVAGQLWRHNQAGDLPKNKNGTINARQSKQLARAASHTRGWTYTHYDPMNKHNRKVIADMNASVCGTTNRGLTVNLSADTLAEADEYYELGIAPVCVTVSQAVKRTGLRTPNGRVVTICPAQTQDEMTCAKCKLCQIKDRKTIVGFIAHGAAKKRMSNQLAILEGNQ